MEIAFAANIEPGKLFPAARAEHCAGDEEFALALAQSDPPDVLAEDLEDPGPPKGGAPQKPQELAPISWLIPALPCPFPAAVPTEPWQMPSSPMGRPAAARWE